MSHKDYYEEKFMNCQQRKGSTDHDLTRRGILGMTVAGLAAGVLMPRPAYGAGPEKRKARRPVLHATDLFRPHGDPDDHWDLACVYALALRGDLDLKGVVIDYPRPERNPDTAAVAQMNLMTGTYVPIAVGSGLAMKSRQDTQAEAPARDLQGVRMLLEVLEQSPQPVVINILGGCRDVAVAGKRNPDLFAQKCAGIYLNAGTGSPKLTPSSRPEYNVTVDKASYAALFDLPCPVYWMPCFEDLESRGGQAVREYGTYYRFQQKEILPHLSEMAQNYFAYMLGRYADSNWFRYLTGQRDEALLTKVGNDYRNMWCTGGFLHAAGYTVSRNGTIMSLDDASDSPVFTFDPIDVTCDDAGLTRWTPAPGTTNRFIFHVRDLQNYQAAMTEAMRSRLKALP